jgi:hypothetical protein
LTPTAWRSRHDDFAGAARDLRRLAVEGRADEALAPLRHALAVHMAYEEDELWPHYAAVAPAEGPGAVRVLARDHRLIEAALVRGGSPGEEAARWALLEERLAHHDQREAQTVLPALDALGVVVDLVEPALPALASAPWSSAVCGEGWTGGLEALAQGGRAIWPGLAHPKAARLEAAYTRAVAAADQATSTEAARDALLAAIDAWSRGMWAAGLV